MILRFFVLGIVFILNAFSALAQQSPIVHTLYLIGDAGEPFVVHSPVGKVLRDKVSASGENATVLFLGDNIYPAGLPDQSSRHHNEAVQVLQTQVNWVKGLGAKVIFVPGNHDWSHWGKKGFRYIQHQQQWIDSLKDEHITLLPRDGCPGPVEISLSSEAVLVIMDTQWILHQWDKPGEDGSCDAKTTAEVLAMVEDVFNRNRTKRIIVAGHHPFVTYGVHGGVFTLKEHIFPLTQLNPSIYLPLPVVGSIYPIYRKWFGHIQDTPHPLYREFSSGMQAIMKEYPGTLYVAGHEHALQYSIKDSVHYIVSGSGAKTEHVRKKNHALVAESVKGFVQLAIHADGSVTTTLIQADEAFPSGKDIFTQNIPGIVKPVSVAGTGGTPEFPAVVRTKASDQYSAGRTKKKLFGENYRKEWAQEVEAPVFDIAKERGGLKILQRGGGQQTLSLRLEDSTGHEYVIRSVEKFPEAAVPEMLRKTFAQDLVQDQISAAHPYGALVIADLAEAAGIYHTNPKLMYVPDDPRLGEYQKDFANMLVLFEERPAGDWSEADHFGNSKKIINTTKVIEKTAEDHDNQVDQQFVLRSRLFDMVIGDWDRHDDQWRWATIKDKKKESYRPIPRDRDQAFFVNEGTIGKIWSRKWALPKFEGFDSDIDWPSGLSFNARYFDRSFLTALSKDEWIAAAEELKRSLTDEAIEKAIRQWPKEIFDLHGQRIINHLKARRNKLTKYAIEHYEFLAREVDITGSDKREFVEVERMDNGDTRVRLFKLTKQGEREQKLYDRTFHRKETREIRIYGLDGDDVFRIKGSSKRAIKTRVIGGNGDDNIADSSRVGGLCKPTFFYDTRESSLTRSSEIKDRTSNDAAINEYNRKSFQYNRLAPIIFGNFNPDDGLFVGAGLIHFTYGFRKLPFRNRHLLLASIAPATQSYNLLYKGTFTEVVGKLNLDVKADIKAPNYVNNFFGMGNESVFNRDIDDEPGVDVKRPIHYYRYRFEEHRFEILLSGKLGKSGYISAGPALQRIEMEDPDNKTRFIEAYATTLPYDLFNEYNAFAGAQWNIGLDKRDHERFTRRGATFNLSGRNMAGLNKMTRDFSSYEATLALYHSFRQHSRLVFAVRAGAGLNTGNYEFYQAQILDGKTELRGYRKTRFYGDKKFYSNFEMRLRLLNFRSYLFPASLGILGFHDLGRVWYKDDSGNDPSSADGTSNQWHKGWGGGVWFTPFNMAVLSVEAGASREGALAYVRLGFLF
jgi:hypothetical protein